MANRDLFRGIDAYDSQRRREPLSKSPLQVLGRRLMVQAAAALLLFCGIVYLYEQESAIGEGVRYIVALASADEQEVMAVGSFADLWQDFEFKRLAALYRLLKPEGYALRLVPFPVPSTKECPDFTFEDAASPTTA